MAAPSTVEYASLDAEEQYEVLHALKAIAIFRTTNDKVTDKPPTPKSHQKALKKPKGFLTHEQLEKIAAQACVKTLQFKDVVQFQGNPVDAVYLVIEGTLAKFQRNADGHSELVEYINAGGQIGQLHMICGSDQASSTAIVDSHEARCVMVSRGALDAMLMDDPQLLRAVCNNLALELRNHVRRSQSTRLVRLVEHLDANTPEVMDHKQTAGDDVTGLRHLIAAAISGIGSMTCGYPLDVARTRIQTEGRGDFIYGFRILYRLWSKEGVGALFRGWGSNAVSHTVQNTAYHASYGQLVRVFKQPGQQLSDAVRLLLGVCAGCFAASLVTPLSIVTFRMQGKDGANHNVLTMALKIISTDGFFSLWHGIGPGLALAVNPCITFYVFDEIKSKYLKRKQATAGDDLPSKLTPIETMILGAVAKAVASTLTFPLLMAKIRMGLFGKDRYPSLFSTFATVLREEGFAGLFKGMGLSLFRSIFIAALEFALRDQISDLVAALVPKKRKSALAK